MSIEAVLRAVREALYLLLVLSTPVLLALLVIGVAAGLLQSATRLRDRTIATVPKIFTALLVLALAGPWIGGQLAGFFRGVLETLPRLGK